MNFLLIFPKWPKLEHQTEFDLPPHGPVVMAAAIPDWVNVKFVDENLEEIPFNDNWDFVGISALLTSQLPRAFQISKQFVETGIQVIFGGIAASLYYEEVIKFASSVFLGEVEDRLHKVFEDQKKGELKQRK